MNCRYFTFTERQDTQPKIEQTGLVPLNLPPMSLADDEQQQSNLSNTTLRRKLFEGMIEDSDDEEKPIPQSSEGDHPSRCVTDIVEARSHFQHVSTKRQVAEDDDAEGNRLMSSPIKTDSFSPNNVMVLTPIQNKNPAAAVNGKNVSSLLYVSAPTIFIPLPFHEAEFRLPAQKKRRRKDNSLSGYFHLTNLDFSYVVLI